MRVVLCAGIGMLGGLLAPACATMPPVVKQQCSSPDAQLADVLTRLEKLRASGCRGVGRQAGDCESVRRELDRLVVVCPGHAATLLANAVAAYDEQRSDAAQQMLDRILAQAGTHPDAAALRARIAMEDGNLQFARRLLEHALRLTPDHAGLHETYGAVLYLAGQLPDATHELTMAAALGAPKWRIAYHLGLVQEASGNRDAAISAYTEALAGNPGWAKADSRLKALRAAASPARP